MKRPTFKLFSSAIVLALMLSLLPAAQPVLADTTAELFISEYIEGSSFNKAIEIYNGTGEAVDLATGLYTLELYSNGSPTISQSMSLTGSIATGDVFVLAHPSADAAILTQADTTSGSVINFNGDDVVVLRKDGVVIDAFGQIGVDPGSQWTGGGQDDTLRRKEAVCAGDTNPDDAFDASIEWDTYAINSFDGLGSHTTTCEITPSQPAELFISEYIEGSSFNKAIEIYNGTSEAVDLATGLYTLELYSNGSPTVSQSMSLTGSIATGDVFVLAHPSADAAILTQADTTSGSVINFNGDDVVVLRKDGVVIDAFGQIGVDPGSQWTGGGQDDTLRRKEAVCAGDTNPDDAFDASIEWDTYAINSFDGLGSHIATCEVTPPPPPPVEVCGDPATFIHEIQGSGLISPLVGSSVSIEAVVVGDFQESHQLGGFFLQEEDADIDGDPLSSEGLFIYDNAFGTDVSIGDVVRVRGVITEYYELTEMNNIEDVLICSSGAAVTPATVNLPVNNVDDWEYYEGMLVNIPQVLAVTDNYTWGRYGEVGLALDSRLYIPTNIALPGADAAVVQDLNNRSRIQLDDGSSIQNPATVPYLGPDNTLRAGDTLSGITAVLSYGFGVYELQPVGTISFDRANPRPDTIATVDGITKVSGFNLLNYFPTIDNSGPICGPAGDQDCRGADTLEEFEDQHAKTVSAIIGTNADVLGLMELENNTVTSIQTLIDGLNAVAGPGTYDFIDTGTIGTDAIRVALIYKPAKVMPMGAYAVLDSSVDSRFIDTKNRPTLAQTFMDVYSGEPFTVVVNHLKSKGSACDDVGDPDMFDGQGNCNLTRLWAVQALVDWLAGDPTGSGDSDFIIVGDLNSYAMEDPIRYLENAGYTNLIKSHLGEFAYSYAYKGEFGYLDHALVSDSLLPQVKGVTEWHINSDEPVALDYNNYNQDFLYQPDAFRSSDHDPVLVGFCFDTIAPELNITLSPDVIWPPNHKMIDVTAIVEVIDADPSVNLTLVSVTSNEPDEEQGIGDGNTEEDIIIIDDFHFQLRAERQGTGDDRIYTITYHAVDACGNESEISAIVTVPHDKKK